MYRALRLGGRERDLYTQRRLPDPAFGGNGSASVPGGGPMVGAGPGAAVSLSAKK